MKDLIKSVTSWASNNMFVEALVLVGSYARGSEREDSNVNLIIVSEDKEELLNSHRYIYFFGLVKNTTISEIGPCSIIKALYHDGTEVHFGIIDKSILEKPLIPEVKRVLTEGYKTLVDKISIMNNILG